MSEKLLHAFKEFIGEKNCWNTNKYLSSESILCNETHGVLSVKGIDSSNPFIALFPHRLFLFILFHRITGCCLGGDGGEWGHLFRQTWLSRIVSFGTMVARGRDASCSIFFYRYWTHLFIFDVFIYLFYYGTVFVNMQLHFIIHWEWLLC